MKTYTMQEACNALAVDSATLYRWMVRAGMFAEVTKQKDEQDKRRRILSQAQVTQLARLHHRSLAQQQPVKPDVSEITELRDRIEALEREMSNTRQRLASLTASTGNLVPASQKTPRNASQRVGSLGPVSSELPTGFVVLRVFAVEHGIAPTSALRAVDSGPLPVERGKWKYGRTHATVALSAEGRAAFYRLFSAHERFTPCEHCPHEEEKEKN